MSNRAFISIVLSLLILIAFSYFFGQEQPNTILFNSDKPSSTSSRAEQLTKSLVGHWVSGDGKEHLYFSNDGKMLKITGGEEIWNAEYGVNFIKGTNPDIDKFKNTILLEVTVNPTQISGFHQHHLQVSFTENKKQIIIDGTEEGIQSNPTGSFGLFNYVDKKQYP